MQCELVALNVRRSMFHSTPKVVPVPEAYLLLAIHGETKIDFGGTKPVGKINLDPDQLYTRLSTLYGEDENETPWTTITFGDQIQGGMERVIEMGAEALLKPLAARQKRKRVSEEISATIDPGAILDGRTLEDLDEEGDDLVAIDTSASSIVDEDYSQDDGDEGFEESAIEPLDDKSLAPTIMRARLESMGHEIPAEMGDGEDIPDDVMAGAYREVVSKSLFGMGQREALKVQTNLALEAMAVSEFGQLPNEVQTALVVTEPIADKPTADKPASKAKKTGK